MRRLPLAVLISSFAVPASAEAGTLAREGSELVYRSGPGEHDYVVLQQLDGSSRAAAGGTGVTPGAGCERRSCSLDGITAVRVLAADGDDQVEIYADVPVIVDLGPGNDFFGGHASSLTVSAGDGEDLVSGTAGGGLVDAGPGNDRVGIDMTAEPSGPLLLTGGAGDDQIGLDGLGRPGVTVAGGAGDDELDLDVVAPGLGIDVSCGPGDDRVALDIADRPGEGCAPGVTGVTPRTVSRRFDEGRVSGPAAVAVTLSRGSGRTRLAQGFATLATAGPLRLRLEPTAAGRRALGRPRLELGVRIRTRVRGDVNDFRFGSRLARGR